MQPKAQTRSDQAEARRVRYQQLKRSSSPLSILKKHLWAAFFLTSGIASALLLLYFAFLVPALHAVNFNQLKQVETNVFTMQLPEELSLIHSSESEDTWVYANGSTEDISSLVVTVGAFEVNHLPADQWIRDVFVDELESETENDLRSSIQNQGIHINSMNVRDFSHQQLSYGYKYEIDGAYASGASSSVRYYLFMNQELKGYEIFISTTNPLTLTDEEQVDVIAQSFEAAQ